MSISDMTFIEISDNLVVTWELEQHIFASEFLVHGGECVQLKRKKNRQLEFS